MSQFAGKRIAVIGAAATGKAAAPVLARLGARVVVYDEKSEAELAVAADQLRGIAELRLGDSTYAGIEECDLIVPSPGVPMEAEVLQAAVRRGQPVLSEIEIAYRIAKAPIVAVTGTNGKTTTVMMAAAILREAGLQVEVAGNTLAGGFQVPLIDAAERLPAEAWIVAEISSFQLEWVDGFRPKVAVITNITADHLNRHHTVENYVAAKARLLESQTADDWTVLNRENPATAGLMGAAKGRLVSFGIGRLPDASNRADRSEAPDADATWAEESNGERWLRGRFAGKVVNLARASALRVPGEHTVENALAAAAVGMAAGVAPEAIERGLASFTGVADRLESVATLGGVEYVNNTMCTNVDAAIRSIQAYDRPVIVIAGGRNKGLDFDPLGRVIAQRVKALVAIGTDGPDIAAAAGRHGFRNSIEARSMREAVRLAGERAEAGDVVLLAPACASFDWYTSFEARGLDFRNEVLELVKEQGSALVSVGMAGEAR